MFSIQFGGRCFEEMESSLVLVVESRNEASDLEEFISNAIDYIITNCCLPEEYRSRPFIEVTEDHEDVQFLRQMIDNMKLAVTFDFEKPVRILWMKDRKWDEEYIGVETEHNYMLFNWDTSA